jgi:hypothetical protein
MPGGWNLAGMTGVKEQYGVSAGISQFSGVPGLDGVVNILLFLVE